jgi:cytochrome oxidase Cu insertion factor (SCO1/SenC/PrrC family)
MTRRAALALTALAAILAVTAAWWALALWPAGLETPGWLARTRAVCFGTRPDGLPDAAGWLVLVGEPIGMLGFLLAAWGGAVREGLGALGQSRPGRAVLAGGSAALVVSLAAAVSRVAGATITAEPFDPIGAAGFRVDRPAPPMDLVDQDGHRVRLADYAGRPVLVAFAYGHCQTVCPTLVHDAVAGLAREAASNPALLIVTLDPWRDRPERLRHIALAWGLPSAARLLGGSVEEVEATLDAWGIVRERDPDTGEVVHPTQVYRISPEGRIVRVLGSQ